MFFISFFYQNNTTFYFPFPQQKYISFFKKYLLIQKTYILLSIYSHFLSSLLCSSSFVKSLHSFTHQFWLQQSVFFFKASFVLQFLWAMFWLAPAVFTFQRHDKIWTFQRQKGFKFSPRRFGMYFFIIRSLRKLLFKIFLCIRVQQYGALHQFHYQSS